MQLQSALGAVLARITRGDAEVSALAWLMELEIIRQPVPGRYYLDEHTLATRNANRFFE